MASLPPLFTVEDSTDEDFFDKLVDNDDDDNLNLNVSGIGNGNVGVDVNEILVTEVDHQDIEREIEPVVELDMVKGFEDLGIEDEVGSESPVKKILSEEGSSSDETVKSVPDGEEKVIVEEKSIKNIETAKNNRVVIKEVQWSAFSEPRKNQANGFGSYSDFLNDFGDDGGVMDPFFENLGVGEEEDPSFSFREDVAVDTVSMVSGVVEQEQQKYVDQYANVASNVEAVASENTQEYWENLGWRIDPSTGQWYQVATEGGFETAHQTGRGNVVSEVVDLPSSYYGNVNSKDLVASDNFISDQRSDISKLQQTAQSVTGTVAEVCTTSSVFSSDTEYPANMVFDPQYPDYYYDTITQEWHLLSSYTPSVQSTSVPYENQVQNGNASLTSFLANNDHRAQEDYGQIRGYESQNLVNNHIGQNVSMWQPDAVAKTEIASSYTQNQHQNSGSIYSSRTALNNYNGQHLGFKPQGATYDGNNGLNNYNGQHLGFKSPGTNDGNNGMMGYQAFVPSDNFSQQQAGNTQQHMHYPNDYYGGKLSENYSHQSFHNNFQFARNPNEGRSSAGRPPHALVTFGFGGKLVVLMNNTSSASNAAFGSQDSRTGGVISIINLMDVVTETNGSSNSDFSASEYFRTLCQQSYPGPVVGGSVGNKELFKWVDERIANCGSTNTDYRKGELSRLLISLLKIACQHYGKLRSPFGTDQASKESDSPESAVAKLFASAKRNGAQPSGHAALTHCLQNLPSESQVQATATEVQNLLISGRTIEALQCAQEGQLWGTALVLAAQLGEQFHIDTVKQMACSQFLVGSPLRTLCLLIAGQPAEVFAGTNITSNGSNVAATVYQPPTQIPSNCMLDAWEENLAVITANRTKGDDLVIIHLGDCLYKERGEITAAHICYLVGEANFESYSDSARLCLIGADHWKYPRTFASPEAIQRTELYEYSMVLGNSQSVLLPFQPYKLVYAHMLAEVGKVSDSIKYCQAILKSLKTGRAPEVETWKQMVVSLEERLKTNQQGGYGTNLAPKLVGKLFPFIDRSIHRMIGASPPPAPLISPSSIQSNESDNHSFGPRVSNSQSTMAMSSLMSSDMMEPVSGWAGDSNRKGMHNRSVSEPDFGRTPRQVASSKKAASSDAQVRSAVPSRLGRFGSNIISKTMGWVSRSQSDKQAKLGDTNKFYYDEKLKRWVEEGADPPKEEAPLAPPPTMAFQNGISDYNTNDVFKSEGFSNNGGPTIKSPTPSERNSGIPPIPPSSNQLSARGRTGVRSRYVDTFNKGGDNPATSFMKSPTPSPLPTSKAVGAATNAKFFIPTSSTSGEQIVDTSIEDNIPNEASPSADSIFSTPPPSLASASSLSSPMQRFPSMDNIAPSNKGTRDGTGFLSSRSRRTNSWSGGSFNDSYSQNGEDVNGSYSQQNGETFNKSYTQQSSGVTSLGEALGMPQTLFNPSPTHQRMNVGNFADDLHEVEL